jgi:flagellar hook-associated protein 3 FlgL
MMRVSTATMYADSAATMTARQSEVYGVQQQLGSGLRINNPSDDPVGAGKAATLDATVAQFGQYKSNQAAATNMLSAGQSTLQSFIDALQTARETIVQAGNGSLSDNERSMLASSLQGSLQTMVGLANTGDGAGGYLFAGSKDNASPFSTAGNAVSYNGDSTGRSLEVSTGRQLQVKYAGDDLFMNLKPGNGTFVTAAGASNAGSGIVDPGSVTNPAAVTGHNYTISFASAGAGTTYTVTDTTSGSAVAGMSNVAFTSPATIAFDGIQVGISGAPKAGDNFTVAPAGNQSIFDTMKQAIQALQTPASTATGQAAYQTGYQSSLASMDQALSHLSLKIATYGTQLNEVDAYGTVNAQATTDAQSQLSSVRDLDYAQAATQLSQKQLSYQAALQSYSMVSKLSLFNFL